jgi:hypothetical protein
VGEVQSIRQAAPRRRSRRPRPPQPPRPPVAAALAALADYHTHTALILNGENPAYAAEVAGGPVAVHAARLAAELAALLSAVAR